MGSYTTRCRNCTRCHHDECLGEACEDYEGEYIYPPKDKHGWVSVEWGFPDSERDVLVFSKHGINGAFCDFYMVDEDENDTIPKWWCEEHGFDFGVTHWMELPEDPE